jgi:Fe-Mn family superoxide dismutase
LRRRWNPTFQLRSWSCITASIIRRTSQTSTACWRPKLKLSPRAISPPNAGGHINHSLFWKNLAPADSAEAKSSAAPELVKQIKATWGDEENFKEAFNAALLGIQGSGWGWLIKVETGKEQRLAIVTTKDQDPVVGKGEVPVFGVDMWEHAYYLQYQNGKAAYVKNIWNVINWKTAEERFLGSRADAFKILKASI